jgi:hypothetical protein
MESLNCSGNFGINYCPGVITVPAAQVTMEAKQDSGQRLKSAIAYLRKIATGNYLLCWADINAAIDVIESATADV